MQTTTRLAAAAVLLVCSGPMASATGNASRGRGAFASPPRALPDRKGIEVKGIQGLAEYRQAHWKSRSTVLAEPLEVRLLLTIGSRHEMVGVVAIDRAADQGRNEIESGVPGGPATLPGQANGLAQRLGGSIADLTDRILFGGRSFARVLLRSAFAALAVAAHYTEPDQARTVDLAEALFAGAQVTYDLARGRAVLEVALSDLMPAIDYLATVQEVDS